MAELRHEWNKMQAEATRARIARDTIKHRDRRIRELEVENEQLRGELDDLRRFLARVERKGSAAEAEGQKLRKDNAALVVELRKDPATYGWIVDWLEG